MINLEDLIKLEQSEQLDLALNLNKELESKINELVKSNMELLEAFNKVLESQTETKKKSKNDKKLDKLLDPDFIRILSDNDGFKRNIETIFNQVKYTGVIGIYDMAFLLRFIKNSFEEFDQENYWLKGVTNNDN
jgi:hypothetical protein